MKLLSELYEKEIKLLKAIPFLSARFQFDSKFSRGQIKKRSDQVHNLQHP